MRSTTLAAVLLVAPGLALAQDAPAPRPTGTLLFDAIQAQADLVVGAPDLPALLAAASEAGLGDAAAWRAAFDAQLKAWGAAPGDPERLARGAGALLDAADGEAVLAAMSLKLPGRAGANSRATLFAMRTTRDAKTLVAAFDDVVAGGLSLRYEGRRHVEEIGGRPVVALPGNDATLYVAIQDGLVVACDHPLALGLFFRGLAAESKAAPIARPAGKELRLSVRHGRGEGAWQGWIWGEDESVTWTTALRAPPTGEPPGDAIVAVASKSSSDMPLMPVPFAPKPPVPSNVDQIGITDGGGHFISLIDFRGEPGTGCDGGASRLGWLRVLSEGRIAAPMPGLDAAVLREPYASAAKAAGEKAGEFIHWKSPEAGRLTGPIGHGPATFLALRTLHDIGHGIAPGETAPAAAPKPRWDAPLPPPTEPKTPLPPVEPKDR
jgi:hypothetical protein